MDFHYIADGFTFIALLTSLFVTAILLAIAARGLSASIPDKRLKGFTLIELLIVMAVITILASIALPSYKEFINKARRSDAMGALTGLAGAMQRYYTEMHDDGGVLKYTYKGATVGSGGIYPEFSPLDGATKYYKLEIRSADDSSYRLKAIPQGSQSGDKCGTLTLESNGVESVIAATATAEECWR